MDKHQSSGRVATTVIGILLVFCGGWILYEVPSSNVAGIICGGIILFLGIEALVAALRGRPALLSKAGPLP